MLVLGLVLGGLGSWWFVAAWGVVAGVVFLPLGFVLGLVVAFVVGR